MLLEAALVRFNRKHLGCRRADCYKSTHVSQYQRSYPVRLRGAIRLGLSYHYKLAMDRTLADYNMEAQGDVLADYFVLRYLGSAASMPQPAYASELALYEHVLAGFLADPASRKNLPKSILPYLR